MSTASPVTPEHQAAVKAAYDALRSSIKGFKDRPSQRRMIGACARAFVDGNGLLAEAPCGTGKSLAYLTAGAPLALKLDRTLVISTGTVALQEQLMLKDIPAFLKATGIDAPAVIAKGRGRYFCPRNAKQLIGNESESADQELFGPDLAPGDGAWPRPPAEGEAEAVSALMHAFEKGAWDGDLDSANPQPSAAIRSLVTTTAGGCSGRSCAFASDCPALKARKAIKTAKIIVCNHALLLQDLQIPNEDGGFGGAILSDPAKSIIVCDEGHNIPSVAIDAASSEVHIPSTTAKLAKMERLARKGLRASGKEEVAGRTLADVGEPFKAFSQSLAFLEQAIRSIWTPDTTQYAPAFRAPNGKLPQELIELAVQAKSIGIECDALLGKLGMAIKDADALNPSLRDRLGAEIGIAIEQLNGWRQLMGTWGSQDAGEMPTARWVALGSDQGLVLRASPICAGKFLDQVLWRSGAHVVLTSATLSAAGDFRRIISDAGTPPSAPCLSLPSPFDLATQGRIVVPAIQALPNEQLDHAKEVALWLNRNLNRASGCLVLFTSRRKMEEVAKRLDPDLRKIILIQGELPRPKLLDRHFEAIGKGRGSVILGLHGFGEGLDLKGEALTELVITQLPFAVPDDPVGATYAEWVEKTGGNSFADISVPDAIQLLQQYVGRLIRDDDDRGTIYLLDRRVVTKAYGRRILKALEPFPVTKEQQVRLTKA